MKEQEFILRIGDEEHKFTHKEYEPLENNEWIVSGIKKDYIQLVRYDEGLGMKLEGIDNYGLKEGDKVIIVKDL